MFSGNHELKKLEKIVAEINSERKDLAKNQSELRSFKSKDSKETKKKFDTNIDTLILQQYSLIKINTNKFDFDNSFFLERKIKKKKRDYLLRIEQVGNENLLRAQTLLADLGLGHGVMYFLNEFDRYSQGFGGKSDQ